MELHDFLCITPVLAAHEKMKERRAKAVEAAKAIRSASAYTLLASACTSTGRSWMAKTDCRSFSIT